ncbi:hypothetical protein F5Y15DRAFT_420526 [Xylariaceae sp. FL0016]|nr:hypothetical protein F5Y15DRAFT_420526 [Xylariaceae sp. FL0016]
MEKVKCTCVACHVLMGNYWNLWIQIRKNYISPIIKSDITTFIEIKTSGEPRPREPNTLIDQCKIQDIARDACGTTLGTWCLKAPPSHAL